jgi:hypothetical protein
MISRMLKKSASISSETGTPGATGATRKPYFRVSRLSRQSRASILEKCFSCCAHVQTIESLAYQNSYSAAC